MDKYRELVLNPPKLSIKQDAREVIFYVVSVMCDNKYTIRLKKNNEGDFKMSITNKSGYSFAYGNFGFKFQKFEIEWEADAGHWDSVILSINSGSVKIEDVISR